MEPEPPATLTPEQRARMEEWLAAHPYGEQDANGITGAHLRLDLSLLRANLKLTITERYRNHQRALKRAQEVRDAGIRAGLR